MKSIRNELHGPLYKELADVLVNSMRRRYALSELTFVSELIFVLRRNLGKNMYINLKRMRESKCD